MSDTSIKFLEAFHPDGPWVLTAIGVDRKSIVTKTFAPAETAVAHKWITAHNKSANIYFSVNRPKDTLTKKAEREDIHTLAYLHVDIDARVGEPLNEELQRIYTLITEKCPVQAPTFIVFSGGGYQAFWQLMEPIEIAGDLELARELARYNKQLEIMLGGDNCHNIDRIMRLPGTTNIPNAKKVERGRQPVLAELKHHVPANVYPLASFQKAPDVQMDGSLAATVHVPEGNIARLGSVDELDRWKVPDRVKVIVVQGFDVDTPKEGDNSRSAWLFDCCCQLVRAGVPDEVIFSVITDPDFAISGSVLEKQPNAAKYAARQIERAKEEVDEPWLRQLNERFTVIGNLGGRCRVVEEVPDHIFNRSRLTKQSFQDFANRFNNVFLQQGRRLIPVGQWWLHNPKRRQFDFLVFAPGRETPGSYNMWQGFAVSAIPGTKHLGFLEHVRENICGGIPLFYDYMIGWMARAVQRPDHTGQTAIVLRGEGGTGKSFFAKQFGQLFGRHFLQVSDAKHLVGNFNAHLRDCVVLFGDEAFYAGDKRHESVLKMLITEEQIMIENKGVDAEVSGNFIHLILASNNEWVVPAGPAERRFFVLDVSNKRRQDSTYFRAIDKDMRSGGRESLLRFLLDYDISHFEVRTVPTTQALIEQKLHSLEPVHHWWLHRLMEGTLTEQLEVWGQGVVPCYELGQDYTNHIRQFGGGAYRRDSAVKLGIFLQKMCPSGWPKKWRAVNGRIMCYEFPSLEALRQHWDQHHHMSAPWPACEEETAQAPERLPF